MTAADKAMIQDKWLDTDMFNPDQVKNILHDIDVAQSVYNVSPYMLVNIISTVAEVMSAFKEKEEATIHAKLSCRLIDYAIMSYWYKLTFKLTNVAEKVAIVISITDKFSNYNNNVVDRLMISAYWQAESLDPVNQQSFGGDLKTIYTNINLSRILY